jgi:predicted amidohydrolase
MAEAPGSDLYVLPEMWSTGFATEPDGIAESESNSVSLSWMRSTARRLHCAISGSLAIAISNHKVLGDAKRQSRAQSSKFLAEPSGKAERKAQSFVNRHYFIDGRSGNETYYDKHHLFTYGHEDRYYQPGDAHSIVKYCGFRILLLTCYDLRFPVWSRYSDALQYDAIIAVANWPESRQNAWQILTRARAMENQAYLIGCNRVGDDQYSHYRGQSAIISPIGKTLASCQPNKEQTVSFTLDLETICHQRSKFKVLDDRDIR